MDLGLMGGCKHYSVSSYPPMLVLAQVLSVAWWAGGMLNEAILNALVGINQIETQTWLERQSVTLVSSLPKLGNESRLYKIVVLKYRLLGIQLYNTP